ncbi:hypothetical protein [Streptomyces sp. NPDC058847]|uniref:hypothetical protein n=1 Tax=Streptomyces sp. NPDC058847 TaxID=3346649 RepID=UPI003699636B
MTVDETGVAQAEKDFRALLLTLGILRDRVNVSWRTLAARVGVPRSTLVSWLRHAKVPDEVDGVRKTAGLLLSAARATSDTSTVDQVLRLDGVDWAQAHAAVQASRAEGRTRSARSGRARRSSPQQDVPAQGRDSVAHRKVSSWTARQLRVHAAVCGEHSEDVPGQFVLPHYVPREHDARVHAWLRQLVEHDEAALLVLRGGSCTGKTRTAYEAVQAVMPGWHLLYWL